ncbi:MAG: acyl-CoA dehydrogenase [Proteobacteria bacterium]|nr:acyl-CoA dehydrogenase [Pseudomonadota bacterium]
MDFRLTEEQKALKKEFEAFFEAEMKNAPPEYHESGPFSTDEGFAFHKHMAKAMGKKGWLTRPWPKEYGGADAPIMEQAIFNEARAVYNAPGVDIWGLLMIAPTILIGGTDEQKARLLPPIARGDVQYCQGWSEPDAGSDLASLKMLAIKDGDHYVINGQKIWTSGGHRADHIFILARTDPDSERSRGLSIFVLPMDLPGIEVRPIQNLDLSHHFNEVFFKDVRIHEQNLIGTPDEGWGLTRQTMNFERSGSHYFEPARIRLQTIVDYAKTTKRNGQLLSKNPIIRQKLAKLHTDIQAGVALGNKILYLQEQGGLAMEASLPSEVKVYSTELGQRMANVATEIMGLYGQVYRSEWAPLGGMVSLYTHAPGENIAAGSSEIQRNLIAWAGLKLPRFK